MGRHAMPPPRTLVLPETEPMRRPHPPARHPGLVPVAVAAFLVGGGGLAGGIGTLVGEQVSEAVTIPHDGGRPHLEGVPPVVRHVITSPRTTTGTSSSSTGTAVGGPATTPSAVPETAAAPVPTRACRCEPRRDPATGSTTTTSSSRSTRTATSSSRPPSSTTATSSSTATSTATTSSATTTATSTAPETTTTAATLPTLTEEIP